MNDHTKLSVRSTNGHLKLSHTASHQILTEESDNSSNLTKRKKHKHQSNGSEAKYKVNGNSSLRNLEGKNSSGSQLDKQKVDGSAHVANMVTTEMSHKHSKTEESPPKKRKRDVFQYGNFNRYYGYRNHSEPDLRMSCFKKEWFNGKDVLDVGCNVGFVTLQVAKDFDPRKIIGLDIDGKLVSVARKNIRHYIDEDTKNNRLSRFPISFTICHGPLATTSNGEGDEDSSFPNNVLFVQGNYVLDSEELLETQQPEFDTILLLSITKWIHLNWGDEGIRRVFKRAFVQLRPGGIMVLEMQPWSSYGKRKKMTETTMKNYHSIRLRPEKFIECLLSKEVGFANYEVIDIPYNASKGFRRPLLLFRKGVIENT